MRVEVVAHTTFDRNGLVYFLGTEGGTAPFRNPHELKLLTVCHSDFPYALGDGEPALLVAREPWRVDVMTADRVESWIGVDLGPDCCLAPTAYSMQHGYFARQNAVRSWVLQGSVDDVTWEDLSEHHNDETLQKGYSSATWPLSSRRAYRYLRVKQTDRNSSGNYRLAISKLEFYGSLFRRTSGESRPGSAVAPHSPAVPEPQRPPQFLPPLPGAVEDDVRQDQLASVVVPSAFRSPFDAAVETTSHPSPSQAPAVESRAAAALMESAFARYVRSIMDESAMEGSGEPEGDLSRIEFIEGDDDGNIPEFDHIMTQSPVQPRDDDGGPLDKGDL